MAAYRRVYDSHQPQVDCQEPGSAPEPYARYSTMGYLYLYTYLCVCEQRSYQGVTPSWPACLHTSATHRHRGFAATTAPTSTSSSGCCDSRRRLFPTPPHTQASTLTMAGRPLGGSRSVLGRRRRCPRGAESTWKRTDMTCQPPPPPTTARASLYPDDVRASPGRVAVGPRTSSPRYWEHLAEKGRSPLCSDVSKTASPRRRPATSRPTPERETIVGHCHRVTSL